MLISIQARSVPPNAVVAGTASGVADAGCAHPAAAGRSAAATSNAADFVRTHASLRELMSNSFDVARVSRQQRIRKLRDRSQVHLSRRAGLQVGTYVCGPDAWTSAVLRSVRRAGAAAGRLHLERFAW